MKTDFTTRAQRFGRERGCERSRTTKKGGFHSLSGIELTARIKAAMPAIAVIPRGCAS